MVAAPLYVSARTSNPLVVSVTTGVAMLPWLLFALPAGVLVDRVDRRRLMAAIDWARTALMGVLGVAVVTGLSSIILLDLVLFLVNMGETAFEPAAQSMIPALVPRDRHHRPVLGRLRRGGDRGGGDLAGFRPDDGRGGVRGTRHRADRTGVARPLTAMSCATAPRS